MSSSTRFGRCFLLGCDIIHRPCLVVVVALLCVGVGLCVLLVLAGVLVVFGRAACCSGCWLPVGVVWCRFSAKHVEALVARPAPGGAGPGGSRLACPHPCLLHWRQGPRPNRCLGPGMGSGRVRSALRARGAAWLAAVRPGVSFATGRAGSGAGGSRPDPRAPADPRATPARTRAATVHARTWRAAAWPRGGLLGAVSSG